MSQIIVFGNDWVVRRLLTRWNEDTGEFEAAQGLAPIAYLSATADGEPIHADLQVALVERVEDGDYFGVIDGAAITEHLTAGESVYEIVKVEGDYTDAVKIPVRAARMIKLETV